jgi:hypothetical protein
VRCWSQAHGAHTQPPQEPPRQSLPRGRRAGAQAVLAAQAELASAPGISHRVKPIDLLLAATADEHRLGVLHYDHDYDVIASHCGLTTRSVWIAPRGSMA